MNGTKNTDVFIGGGDEKRIKIAVVVVGITVEFVGGDIEVVGAVDEIEFFDLDCDLAFALD